MKYMELSRISDIFWKMSPNLFFLSIFLGAITGVCYALLIPFVIYATGTDISANADILLNDYSFFNSPTADMAKIFLATCIGILLIKSLSTILSLYIAQKASVEHRIHLYKRINMLSYVNLEKIGQARLINLLNVDIPALTGAATTLPLIWVSLVTVFGTLGYLIYLNTKVFAFVMLCLCIAVITYQVPIYFSVKFFAKARQHYDHIQQGVKGLIYGAKELKLSKKNANSYINDELIFPEKAAFKDGLKASSIMTLAEVYGEIISFIVIAIVIFHLPYIYQITTMELFGIVMALLYLAGPVRLILNGLASIQQGKVALNKISSFYLELVDEQSGNNEKSLIPWQTFSLSNVDYQYAASSNEFALKNINITFNRGQITFIVGGNGSGKSTLSKVISLHYHASKGGITLGENSINSTNIDSARECISVIYSDFYVFPKLFEDYGIEQINHYLNKLELSDKVQIVNNRFSTTSLSDGQRKRLALLSLLLDNREICLFDEWASDQDPRFKAIFYQEILPELKAQNRVVIVISHDDRYFDCADQLITMEQGSVRSIIQQEPATALAS